MPFSNLGWEEILLLAVIGLVIFGPDRLPKAIKDVSKVIRELRAMAQSAATDLKAELGPEMADLDLRSLNPRRFVEDAIFGDDTPKSTAGTTSTSSAPAVATLEANEPAPYDTDAT